MLRVCRGYANTASTTLALKAFDEDVRAPRIIGVHAIQRRVRQSARHSWLRLLGRGISVFIHWKSLIATGVTNAYPLAGRKGLIPPNPPLGQSKMLARLGRATASVVAAFAALNKACPLCRFWSPQNMAKYDPNSIQKSPQTPPKPLTGGFVLENEPTVS